MACEHKAASVVAYSPTSEGRSGKVLWCPECGGIAVAELHLPPSQHHWYLPSNAQGTQVNYRIPK